MKKDAKSQVINEIAETLNNSKTFYLIDFKKMKVSQSVELRKLLRKNKFSYMVVKNRLALRALNEMIPADIRPVFDGPTAIAAAAENPTGLARLIKDFSAQGKILAVKGAVVEGAYLPQERFDEICRIKSREELLGKIAFMMSYELSRFLRTLQAPLANMGNLMTQLKDRKKE